jgi:hypothetical protein
MFLIKGETVFNKGVMPLLGTMAAAAALVLAGCGGSDDGSTSTAAVTVEASALTKAEFQKKATEICAKGTASVQDVVQNAIVGKSSVEAVEAAVFPVVEGFVTEISALGAPKGEEADVEAFLTALQEDTENAKSNPSDSMAQLAKNFKASGDLARRYEIESCSLG